MLLKTASAFGLLKSYGENLGALFSPASSPPSLLSVKNFEGRNGVVCAARHTNSKPLTGVVFEPFEEVKKELLLVPSVPQDSLARHKFADESEAAINEQINVEYNVSYVYHAMYAYFDRDNVALKGLAKFFNESSLEEREHAEKLMEYQNKRGGKVKLQSILMPLSEFDHAEKGDALYAMELALSLEKLTNEKLLNLHAIASRNNDVQLTDFIESEYLAEQVESIKKISEYVAQLRRAFGTSIRCSAGKRQSLLEKVLDLCLPSRRAFCASPHFRFVICCVPVDEDGVGVGGYMEGAYETSYGGLWNCW
ncbi:Ferritin-2, chloroplastic [Sesamum angolense]|uniref:Ferritin n=1 Tax=Sesamum angolense TaxID=2727404 RepID=A0AAE1W241_9LAMI|nr:Ferritin-2, chloroplastic [Sesamum angolense]